jgi:hypothetical protein
MSGSERGGRKPVAERRHGAYRLLLHLSLSPAFLKLPEAGSSRNQASKWMTRAEAACGTAVRNQIAPAVESTVADVLGKKRPAWLEFLTDPNTNSPVLVFHYPSSQPAGFDYLKRSVKLEFGSLTDQQPVGRHPVRPWIAGVLPDVFADWRCDVVALEVDRSFWEKATILHMEYHRPAEKPTPDRFSRHYADTAALAKHPTASKAVDQHELRNRVVQWKSQFFGSSWANYDNAKPGTFRLVPPPERQAALRRDYQAMRDMYLAEPASFDDILTILADLEKRINLTGG